MVYWLRYEVAVIYKGKPPEVVTGLVRASCARQAAEEFATVFQGLEWSGGALAEDGPYLRVSYSVGALEEGQRPDGLDLLAEARAAGIELPGAPTIPEENPVTIELTLPKENFQRLECAVCAAFVGGVATTCPHCGSNARREV